MLLSKSQLNMLLRVREQEKMQLRDVSDDQHKVAVRLSMDGYLRFHGSRFTGTGYYELTLKGWEALEA